jgi:hypothetical protein
VQNNLPLTELLPNVSPPGELSPTPSARRSSPEELKPRNLSALLVAFHYPPCATSSGLHRSVCLSRDLPNFGWSPIVLTAHPRAYRERRDDQLSRIPLNIEVHRSFAIDTTRHLSLRGRYPGWMALPDPWVTWLAGAIPRGLHLIGKHRPDVIWSTYPIASAHLIGHALHRWTGVPWVADFRDPMTEIDADTQQKFPSNSRLFAVRRWIEKRTIQSCQRAVFVTPASLALYRNRYPEHAHRMRLVENGYDEQSFVDAEQARTLKSRSGEPLELVHSGTLYPGPDRDADAFLAALVQLRGAGKISAITLRVRLRATGYDDYYRERISYHGIGDLVKLEPSLPYNAALTEMLDADGLLLFQGSTSNSAVPAKLYEYLRARRPIFALVDERGDTAAVLRETNVGNIVPLHSIEQIAAGLLRYLEQIKHGTAPIASDIAIERHSRNHKALEMARLFEEIVPIRGLEEGRGSNV